MKPIGERTILGIDFGTKSIGLAIGQEITGSAQPLPAVKANNGIPNWDQILKVVKEWMPDLIVVGLPLNMDGTEQDLTKLVHNFANELKLKTGKQVELKDERLTTVSAREHLFNNGGYKALKKGKIDSFSAVLIAESYMENLYN